ncbi:hypothetical protein [Roseovarius nanhaiticus]|uniref:hypothetical protein n=1 Tax=Roseovarius nanhaiticus TaxID=573024 RepID=UPI002491812A|nr:hypothetical protein [Roseovarius nanhaiticus]
MSLLITGGKSEARFISTFGEAEFNRLFPQLASCSVNKAKLKTVKYGDHPTDWALSSQSSQNLTHIIG